jgi:hypothetical protein
MLLFFFEFFGLLAFSDYFNLRPRSVKAGHYRGLFGLLSGLFLLLENLT